MRTKWKMGWLLKGNEEEAAMVKQIGIGLLLALQFFSTFPVKKNLPMNKSHVNAMFIQLPLIGLLFGGIMVAAAHMLRETATTGSLLLAFLIVLLSLVMSGGLHMDGLADVADAYFSYQEKEKRLEIMGDPRIGAFGAMALILTITGKIIIVSETILLVPIWVILFIPVLSRIGLLLLFSSTPSAKTSGLAAFFQNTADKKKLAGAGLLWLVITLSAAAILVSLQIALAFLILIILGTLFYRQWCRKNFGGVTGDLFGTYVEGAELLLWTMLLFFI